MLQLLLNTIYRGHPIVGVFYIIINLGMKKCSQCEKELDESMFRKNSKSRDGLKPYCKICANTKYFPRKTVDLPEGEKRCWRCWTIQSFEQFAKTKRKLRGCVRSRCKTCETAYYYETSKDSPTIKESKRKWWIKYHGKNRDKRNKYCREYHDINKEQINPKQRQYYRDNIEMFKKYMKENRLRYRVISSKRRALIRTTDDWTVTLEAVQTLYEIQKHKCAICSCDLDELTSDKKNLDHIIPISKWWLHSISNLQWTCQFCNYSKGAKELVDSSPIITI